MPNKSPTEHVLDGIASALWVTAYADYCDELGKDVCEERGLATAGAGEDWNDVAPEPPEEAQKAAMALLDAYMDRNGIDLSDLMKKAGVKANRPHDVKDGPGIFGWCLGMMALGHGVSWFDDHPEFELVSPSIESHLYEADNGEGEFTWSLERAHMNPRRPRRLSREEKKRWDDAEDAEDAAASTSYKMQVAIPASVEKRVSDAGVDLEQELIGLLGHSNGSGTNFETGERDLEWKFKTLDKAVNAFENAITTARGLRARIRSNDWKVGEKKTIRSHNWPARNPAGDDKKVFVVKYKDEDPSSPVFSYRVRAYDQEHALMKWYDGDTDGWTLLSITPAPSDNPAGDDVDVTSGPARGHRGRVISESASGRTSFVELERGGRAHLERGALRTRGARR